MSTDLDRTRSELLGLLHPPPQIAAAANDEFPRSNLMRWIIHRGRGWAVLGLTVVALVAARRRRSPRALVPLLGLIAGAGRRLLRERRAITHVSSRPRVAAQTMDTDGPRRV